MTAPGFSAEASLYRPTRHYTAGPPAATAYSMETPVVAARAMDWVKCGIAMGGALSTENVWAAAAAAAQCVDAAITSIEEAAESESAYYRERGHYYEYGR
jgi:hypothetical protein